MYCIIYVTQNGIFYNFFVFSKVKLKEPQVNRRSTKFNTQQFNKVPSLLFPARKADTVLNICFLNWIYEFFFSGFPQTQHPDTDAPEERQHQVTGLGG